ncbi:hypothetical protein ACVWZ3_009631 [Bradyrhizobium sp. i1.3.6]
MQAGKAAAIPLARKEATFSFCHGSRSVRTTTAILVSNCMTVLPLFLSAREERKSPYSMLARIERFCKWATSADGLRVKTDYIDFTSPPSIRNAEPVIQRAPGDTRNAINSAISSGSP